LDRSPDPGLFERVGVHVLTFHRLGDGRSSPLPERTVLSVADDALALADALGPDRFALLGVSGGGPHALAIAYRARSERVRWGLPVNMMPAELVEPDELIAINREGESASSRAAGLA
jgi:pimeloyl-ACP methyl ester carboxylesterase